MQQISQGIHALTGEPPERFVSGARFRMPD